MFVYRKVLYIQLGFCDLDFDSDFDLFQFQFVLANRVQLNWVNPLLERD